MRCRRWAAISNCRWPEGLVAICATCTLAAAATGLTAAPARSATISTSATATALPRWPARPPISTDRTYGPHIKMPPTGTADGGMHACLIEHDAMGTHTCEKDAERRFGKPTRGIKVRVQRRWSMCGKEATRRSLLMANRQSFQTMESERPRNGLVEKIMNLTNENGVPMLNYPITLTPDSNGT